jgi:putative transposase
MSARTISYKNHRFPPQIIAHAVWLYFWFPLSLRLAEEMLLERSIVVSCETIRRWAENSVRPTQSNCAERDHRALAIHIHRIRAMPQWKAVTGAAA